MKKNHYFLSENRRTVLYAVTYEPEDREVRAVVQICHGMAQHIGQYHDFAKYLARHGILVAGHDYLGHGNSVDSRGGYGYIGRHPAETLVADIHRLRRITTRRYPDRPYFMLGHSMGSYLLRQYLALWGDGLAGALLLGTGYVPPALTRSGIFAAKAMAFFTGWRHRSLFIQALMFNRSYRAYDITNRHFEKNWLTKDPVIFQSFRDDLLCGFRYTLNGHLGLFETVYASCRRENIDRIPKDLPLLLASGAKDPVGDLGRGVKRYCRLLREAGCSRVTMKLYPDDRHEILNESDRDIVWNDIRRYIERLI